jgi:hypothetical protein
MAGTAILMTLIKYLHRRFRRAGAYRQQSADQAVRQNPGTLPVLQSPCAENRRSQK